MALELSRIRALCFDVDGTLRDTDDQFVFRLMRGLNLVRWLFPNQDPLPMARRLVMATEYPGNLLLHLPDRLGIDGYFYRLADLTYRLGISRSAIQAPLIPGVDDALRRFRVHYQMAIVSARGEWSTQAFLRYYQLSGLFQCVATAQTCRHTKPYPDPIRWAAKQMGVSTHACLMVGDTTADIRAGRAAGAQTVGVLCGFGEEAELRQAGADLILGSVTQLSNVLMAKMDQELRSS